MKTIYIPTDNELLKMGFDEDKEYKGYYELWTGKVVIITYYEGEWIMFVEEYPEDIYPQSKEDIETLIRLFTK